MPNRKRAYAIVLPLLAITGIGAAFLYRAYNKKHAAAPVVQLARSTAPWAPGASSVAPAIANPSPGVGYVAHFDSGGIAGWSSMHIDTTPNQPQRKFLGPIHEEPVTFTLQGLPAHQFIHLTFELLTYAPWNGDSQNFGRDLWDMRVAGGQPLIHTTFSNCGFFENNNEQSFPDQYPWYPTHPGWTGAATRQSLGYDFTWGRNGKFGTDSTYRFDITFPHTAATLALEFKSQTKNHQSHPYGFLNFKVETVDHSAGASPQQIAAWWNDLAQEDPIKAYHAVWSLIATPDAATKYIEAHLPPPDHSIPINIDQSAPAQYGLFEYATPESRQFARAIHVLEVINSAESKKLLAAIGYAGTPQGAPPTRWDHGALPVGFHPYE